MFPTINRGTAFGNTRASEWTELTDAVRDNQGVVATLRPTLPGVGSKGFAEAQAGGVVMEYLEVVQSNFPDFVKAFRRDENGDRIGETIKVAKPMDLRRSTWENVLVTNPLRGNITYTFPFDAQGVPTSHHERTATRGSVGETQVPVPFYSPRTFILAQRASKALTGADDIEWLDMNRDPARAWAAATE